jgi:type IV pilus assembly protein PilQ
VPNPALGQLPALNTPAQPIPWAAPQLVSVSQDVLAKGITIKANKATNSIFLRLYRADMERIKKLVREHLDMPLPQVKIEARMEILDRTALEAIGIQWGGAGAAHVGRTTVVGQGFQSPIQSPGTGIFNLTPSNPNLNLSGLLPVFPDTGLPFGGNLVNLPISALPNSGSVIPAGGIAFGIIGTNWNINLALQALATQGKTRTLARPEIVTVENNRAEISLGEEIPYATVSSAGTQIQFKEALLKLSTTPTVIREKINAKEETKIKLVVVVENNSRGDVVDLGQGGKPPAINRRKADTLVLLNEGERLVIGGVTQTVNQNTVRKVPYLGDIPILGWLFKQKENFETGRELVVFLTPSVLKGVPGQAMTAPAPK